jgi:hypothetical protein
MIADAKEMGIYHSEGWNTDYPKVQIAKIADLLNGQLPQLPPRYKKQSKSATLIQ